MSRKILIADLGNNHFGDYDQFREMIRVAKNSGATHVKSQAGVKVGSMPNDFYIQCNLGLDIYIEAIYWARQVCKIDLFYSIFSPEFYPLFMHQDYHKISASQCEAFGADNFDSRTCFISTKCPTSLKKIKRASLLYASDYLEESPNLHNIELLKELTDDGQVGYSDHSIGIQTCINASKDFGAEIIEKHFTLQRAVRYRGEIFRDTVHGATPDQLDKLAREIA